MLAWCVSGIGSPNSVLRTPFTQGPVDYRKACEAAVRKAIIVNTIHCGAHQTGVSQGWQDGARRGEGLYLSIDQNQTTVYRPTTEDKEIVLVAKRLGERLDPPAALGLGEEADVAVVLERVLEQGK